MTEVKISELPVADQANIDDLLEASQVSGSGWVSRHISLDQVSTVVAASDQITDAIDGAIGELPPPVSDWADITGKPSTFPPTVPIAWTDVSGKPSTFPPTLPIAYSDISGKPSTFPPDPEAVDDRVAALIVAGSNMTATYNDVANTLTLASTASGGGGGTVTSTSVVSANGLAGTVATPTTTPAITLSTTITGMLKGNGTAISAATAGTDYVTPGGLPTSLPPSGAASGDLAGTYPSPTVKASVGLTGTPTAPTATPSTTNTTQIATTAFVQSALPTTLPGPPTGAAGGALTGTYPNPTLVGGPLSNYALTSSIPTTLPPNGAAGGDLSGTYPNPTVKPSVTNGQVLTTVAGVAAWAAAAGGAATSVGTTPPGSPTNGQLWYYSDAVSGGGALYIYYTDPNTSQWVPASPAATPGSLLQTVFTETGAVASGTTTIPFDDTIPQIGEGNEYLTCVITPKSATSKLTIALTVVLSSSVANTITAALFQDSTANALAASVVYQAQATGMNTISFGHTMTSGTTSATTFRVRAGGLAAGTTTFNGSGAARIYGGAMASSIVIQEVA